MKRLERTSMTAEARRELGAVDAALRGESVAAEHLPLAELALATQALRPRPSAEFVQALDARAARRFTSERHGAPGECRSPRSSSHRGEGVGGLRRLRGAAPAFGVGLAVLIAVAVAISLSGSGRGRVAQPAFKSAPTSPRAPLLSVPAPTGPGPSGAAPAGAPAATRQVERTSTLDIGVSQDSIQSAARRVFTLASAFGGYVKQSNVSSGAPLQGGANFDIHLPSATLPSAIAALSHLGHVRSENDTTNDVTDQLSSLRRSLGGLEAERSSLLRQLAAASESQQAARLKARLQTAEARISQLQRTIRGLTARVDFTSLALSLTPEASGAAASGDLTPGAAAGDAAKILEAALAVLVIGGAAVLPLAVILIAGWSAVALTRRRLREQALDAS
jgi:Domain of unknown function (DUF4349)